MNTPDRQPHRPTSSSPHVERIPLRLPESKDCLVEFLVSDLRDSVARAEHALPLVESPNTRVLAGTTLTSVGETTVKCARFFEFDHMLALGQALARMAGQMGRLADGDLAQVTPRIAAILELLKEQADGLAWGTIIRRPVGGLCDAVKVFLGSGSLPPARTLKPGASAMDALITDGVVIRDGEAAPAPLPIFPVADEPAPVQAEAPKAAPAAAIPVPPSAPTPIAEPVARHIAPAPIISSVTSIAPVVIFAPAPVVQTQPEPAPKENMPLVRPRAVEPTPLVPPPAPVAASALPPTQFVSNASDPFSDLFKDYVPVSPTRLDALLGLVSDLVMQKNRLVALGAHTPKNGEDPNKFHEHLSTVTTSVSRVAADLRGAVSDARRIPLSRLCARLTTIVAECAAAAGKDVTFTSEGAETEADCGLLDHLAEPLAAVARAMVDLNIEPARERAAAKKPESGSIKLRASLASQSLLISIEDDGRGLSRRRISRKAARLGIINEQDADRLTDKEVFALLFAPEYAVTPDGSTPDVHALHPVKETIERLGGSIDITGFETRGTTISISVPLHAVTMPALLVEIGGQAFAVPAAGVREVFRSEVPSIPQPANAAARTAKPTPAYQTLQRDDGDLRVLDGCDVFCLPAPEDQPVNAATVVVIGHGAKRIGLRVARAIGTCDIIVRPLDPMALNSTRGPVCGATIREDGAIALVIDAGRAIRLAEDRARSIDRTPPKFGTAA